MTVINLIKDRVNECFKIDPAKLDLVLCVLLSGGNLLLTDEPGTGKTTLAKIISDLFSLQYGRIQFTPDISPTDVTGMNIFNQETKLWELHKGPLFSDLLLVDEINRALPRTQSSLLEAMAEKQITIDRHTHLLSSHFCVIATQNPLEEEGMFDLPSAQKDRFSMNITLNHLSKEDEVSVMLGLFDYHKQTPVATLDDLSLIKEHIKNIPVNHDVAHYALNIIHSFKANAEIKNNISLRAGKDLINTARALAYINGEQQVLPDHIFTLVKPVLNHRVIINNAYNYDAQRVEDIIDTCIKKVKP